MTNAQLLALFQANTSLQTLANAGDDGATAAAAQALAPAVPSNYCLTVTDILNQLGLAAGNTAAQWVKANMSSLYDALNVPPGSGSINMSNSQVATDMAGIVTQGGLTQA